MRFTPGLMVGAFATLAFFSADSRAQFNGAGGNSFDPQISVVNSGAVMDTQATVSADRKYVTLTMRPQIAQLVALRDFVFQNGTNFVGMNGQQLPGVPINQNGNGVANNANGGRNGTRGPLMPALARPPEPTPVLLQEGMHRVDQPAATPSASPKSASPAAAKK